jgi:hypothetical protein
MTTSATSPIRIDIDKYINLSNFLPEYLKDTDVLALTNVFEDFLNEMYTGSPSYQLEETKIDSVSATIDFVEPTTITTRTISILEKCKRLTELHDPNLIDDSDHLQNLANTLGYNVDLNKGEIGSYIATEFSATSADCLDRYLRFVIENLPNWYKIKTTKNAMKVMLYSYGIIADVSFYYTNNYLPESQGGIWKVSDYLNGTNSVENLDDNLFPTPHFIIWEDLDNSTSDAIWDTNKINQIIKSVNSIRPINTVFRQLGGFMQRQLDMYVGGNIHI